MSYSDVKKSLLYEATKRAIDVIFSFLLIILFSPVYVLVAIAIKLESPGPILADTPSRVGRNGRSFKMYKFRSMVQNAHKLLHEDPKYAELFQLYKKGS